MSDSNSDDGRKFEVMQRSQSPNKAAAVKQSGLQQVSAQGRHRFSTLDAMRGVAAFIVVVLHSPGGLFGSLSFARGYLAVDFFFMLSGFVLTYAFQSKLDSGLSTFDFLKLRLIRLYPLYLLGLTLGLLNAIFTWSNSHLTARQFVVFYGLGSLMMPVWNIFGGAGYVITPFDFPEWSVIYELVSNFIYAVIFRRRGWAMLLCIVIVTGILLGGLAVHNGSLNVGLETNLFLLPSLRVTFSFFLGIVIYRVWLSGRVPLTVPPYVPILLLALCLYAPQWGKRPTVTDFLFVAGIFPVLLLMGASATQVPRLEGLFAALGNLSYPVYVLHWPLFGLSMYALTRIRGPFVLGEAPGLRIALVVLLLAVSQGALMYYDTPVRARLGRRLRG